MPDAAARPSTTRSTLRRLLLASLVVTAVAGAATVWTFARVHDSADTLRTRTAPAVLQLVAVRDALVRADTTVVTSFHAESSVTGPRLVGPGDGFRNQIAIASQGLTQVATEDVADGDSRVLQLIQALVVTYTGLVEQADAAWQRDDKALGTTELWNASRLLHGTGGILELVDGLLGAERAALAGEATAAWMTWLATVAVTVLNLALCALLAVGFAVLRRRFRRVLNLGLVAAGLLVLFGFAVVYQTHDTQQWVRGSRAALDRLVDDRKAHASTMDNASQGRLVDLIELSCGVPGCGDTVARFVATVRRATPGRDVAETQLTAEAKTVAARVDATGTGGLPRLPVYPLPLAVGLAIFAGFRPRLLEYRYQPT